MLVLSVFFIFETLISEKFKVKNSCMESLSGDKGRGLFGSKFGIIAATAGSAVGLGNIWRFPYIVGENGGGAFLIVYLFFVIVIGMPAMLAELSIGRTTHRNAYGSFRKLRPGSKWFLIGVSGILTAFLINSFYGVVAGWTLEYLYMAITNQFSGKNSAEIQMLFSNFQLTGWRPIMWMFIFIVLSGSIVLGGVERGIEKFNKILMPILLTIIVVLGIRSVTLPGASEGLKFLFYPDFSKITNSSILMALGQAFFSLSIGMGALITYGSYIKKSDNLGNTVFSVAMADTLIAILAGVAIFPAVFSFGISPDSGPNLVYQTLPNIFAQMKGGYVFALMFFSLLLVATITSTISILEVVVAYLAEEKNMSRRKATVLTSVGIAILGSLCSLSLYVIPQLSIGGMDFFSVVEYISSNIMLPLGGLLIVVFVAWVLGKKRLYQELSSDGRYKVRYFNMFLFIVRYLAPIAIGFVFLNSLGLFGL